MLKNLYYYLCNYKLVKCENCSNEMYLKQPTYGTVSCSHGCTFALYNKYCKEINDKYKDKEDKEQENMNK